MANYPSLNERVQRDMAEFALKVQRDRNEWKARIAAKDDVNALEEVSVENGNPFHPIKEVIVR